MMYNLVELLVDQLESMIEMIIGFGLGLCYESDSGLGLLTLGHILGLVLWAF